MTPDASPTPADPTAPLPAVPRPPQENIWLNLVCNAVLPGVVLTQLSKPERLGPVWGLVVALSIPLAYGLYDLVKRGKWNVFSIIGLLSTLLTGGIGLMKVSNFWFAVKEAGVPLLLGLAIPLSLRSRQPLVRTLLYNDTVLDTRRIAAALTERGNGPGFEALLRWASWVLAGSFFLSAVLNYGLATWIVTATPGSPEQVAQIGKLNWVSWPVIVIPSMAVMMFALFRLLKGIEQLTGLKTDDLFHAAPAKK